MWVGRRVAVGNPCVGRDAGHFNVARRRWGRRVVGDLAIVGSEKGWGASWETLRASDGWVGHAA